MKKTIKKLAALLLAGALAATAALPAFAATVEVKSADGIYDADEKTFIAYEVFDGDWEGGKLTNLKAGDGIDWDSVDWDTVNSAGFDNVINNADDLIAALNGADENAVQKVAKILKDYVKGDGTTVANGGSLPDGYYIVIDESELGDNEVANAALLQVAGDKVIINVKTDKPSVEKKIDGSKDADTGTTGLVDANNGQVNDLVPYVITTKVPNTSHYDHYFMEFNDKVSAGLDISDVDAEDKFSDYKVFIDGVEMNADQYTLIVNATARTIKVSFKDVKGQDGKILKLTYNAKINKNAVVGVTGNPNEVTLKYTNSPDHSGEGEFDDEYVSETPKDIVITYLTGIQILKVDAESNSPLEGAEFSIAGTRTVSTVVSGVEFVEDANGEYYKLATGAYTKTAPTDATAARYDSDASGKKFKKQSVDQEIKTETDVKVSAISGENGIITFNDLGAGTYTITELLAPDGYNKLENPIKVTIGFTAPGTVSTGEEECSWNKSAEENGSFTFDRDSGLFTVTIGNNGGSTLPSTGGMGTTIFYVIGGILVLAAVIVLISKRRVQQ